MMGEVRETGELLLLGVPLEPGQGAAVRSALRGAGESRTWAGSNLDVLVLLLARIRGLCDLCVLEATRGEPR